MVVVLHLQSTSFTKAQEKNCNLKTDEKEDTTAKKMFNEAVKVDGDDKENAVMLNQDLHLDLDQVNTETHCFGELKKYLKKKKFGEMKIVKRIAVTMYFCTFVYVAYLFWNLGGKSLRDKEKSM